MISETSLSLLDRLTGHENEEGWQEFVAIYRPLILSSISKRRIAEADAEDICQETLAQVLRSIASFKHNGRVGAFRTWLKQIVSQKVWRYFQAQQSEQAARRDWQWSTSLQTSSDPELDRIWDLDHDRIVIQQLLEIIRSEFSPSSWRAFQMVVLEELGTKEVAQELSISINAVLIAKSRIMRRLRELAEGLVEIPDTHFPDSSATGRFERP